MIQPRSKTMTTIDAINAQYQCNAQAEIERYILQRLADKRHADIAARLDSLTTTELQAALTELRSPQPQPQTATNWPTIVQPSPVVRRRGRPPKSKST